MAEKKIALRKRPVLHPTDEYVPTETHIGLLEFIEDLNKREPCVGAERAMQLRKATYNNVLELFHLYGSRNFVEFWNFHSREFVKLKKNEFANISALSPFCDYIECFSKDNIAVKQKNTKISHICFGISKQMLEKYYKKKADCEKQGIKFEPPIKRIIGGVKNRDFILYGVHEIRFENGTHAKIEKGAIYNQFLHWCDIQGLTRRVGIMIAMREVMAKYPVQEVKALEEYQTLTDLDEMYILRAETNTPEVSVLTSTSLPLFNKMQEMIKRYNLDPNNITKLSQQGYVNNAIFQLNKKFGEKYKRKRK